jgi:hypothetical protein
MVVVALGTMSATSVVVRPGVVVVIMVVTSRRVGVDVVLVLVLVRAEEEEEEEWGLEEEMMGEEVVSSEGCRTLGGVGGLGEVLRRRRHRLGHLGGGMPRLTGGDHRSLCFGIFGIFLFLFTQCFIYAYMFSLCFLALQSWLKLVYDDGTLLCNE